MKICSVCFEFKESDIRLQPWRYIYEISKRMKSLGIYIKIIANGCPITSKRECSRGYCSSFEAT